MWLDGGLLLRLGLPGFPFYLLVITSKLVNELGANLDCVVTHCRDMTWWVLVAEEDFPRLPGTWRRRSARAREGRTPEDGYEEKGKNRGGTG